MDVIVPTNLVYVLFDPSIPTSSFNFIISYTCTCIKQHLNLQYVVCNNLKVDSHTASEHVCVLNLVVS